MSLKLYTYPNNPRAQKALICAQYNGVTIEVPAFQLGKDNKSAEFLKKNPLGKVPTLDTPKGSIFESNAIARYVARIRADTELYGRNFFESGKVDQWIDFAANEIDMPAATWTYPIFGYMPFNAQTTERAQADIKKTMATLNNHLQFETYLVGNKVTLADIIVSSSLFNLYRLVMDEKFRKPYVNVNRWFTTLINQPEFKAVLGKFELCKVAQTASAKAASPKAAKKASPKAAPKAAPAAAAEEEEAPKPKAKNPLDLLPPSDFVMDAWKRKYSNTETREEALPWFWQNLDKNGYSLWFCDYKYNEELTRSFMSCNLVGGWFQRLDRVRKYAFGCVDIVGKEGDHIITGCWLFRGKDIPAEMKESDDYELYDWVKADPSDKKVQKLVDDYWSWDVAIKGKPFLDGKVFK